MEFKIPWLFNINKSILGILTSLSLKKKPIIILITFTRYIFKIAVITIYLKAVKLCMSTI